MNLPNVPYVSGNCIFGCDILWVKEWFILFAGYNHPPGMFVHELESGIMIGVHFYIMKAWRNIDIYFRARLSLSGIGHLYWYMQVGRICFSVVSLFVYLWNIVSSVYVSLLFINLIYLNMSWNNDDIWRYIEIIFW